MRDVKYTRPTQTRPADKNQRRFCSGLSGAESYVNIDPKAF